MKKNILYLCLAFLAVGFASCSTDPNDAVTKHVYGENETVYLRTDADATIDYAAAFNEGHISPVTISLQDYAQQIQAKTGMTVDELVAGVDNGKVAFYNINSTKSNWDSTAPNYGTNGWGYDSDGKITKDSVAATIELDKSSKSLIVKVPEDAEAGLSISENIGFAVKNGTDYDNYIRFRIAISVTNPCLIIKTISIPTGNYSATSIEFSDCESAISVGFGMTVKEFNTAVQSTDNGMALYMVKADGTWDTTSSYTANGLGYWLDADCNVRSWGSGCQAFVETYDGGVNIGRYENIESGKTNKISFVYADANDHSKYIKFIVNVTFE